MILNKKEFKLFLTFFVIYAVFTQFIGPNESSRLDVTRAIVDEHRFTIDSYHNNTYEKKFFSGHYYSIKAPGISFLAVPVYFLTKPFLPLIPEDLVNEYPYHELYTIKPYDIYVAVFPTIFISGLLSALTVVLVYKILRYFIENENYRFIIAIIYGVGTLSFYYATVLFGHAVATFFGFYCFYLILKMRNSPEFDYSFLAGLSAGLAILTEYPSLIVIFVCTILILLSKDFKKILKFLAGFIIVLSLLLFYNYEVFGNPFNIGYGNIYLLGDNEYNSSKYVDKYLLSVFVKEKISFIDSNSIDIMIKILFYPYRGLFIYNPILIFSLTGLIFMFRYHKTETIIIAFLFIAFLVYNSNIPVPWGGSCFGPRHLLPVIPFLMIPLAFSFEKYKFIVSIFVVLSILINIMGMQIPEESPLLHDLGSVGFYQGFGMDQNPLKDHYLPLFIKNKGPRSAILESLFDDYAFIVMYLLIGISLYLIWCLFPFNQTFLKCLKGKGQDFDQPFIKKVVGKP